MSWRVPGFPSLSWLSDTPCPVTLMQSSGHGRLCRLYLLAALTSAAVGTPLCKDLRPGFQSTPGWPEGGLLDHVGILLHLVGDCHIICHSSPAFRHSSSNRCLCVCLSVSVSQCVCLCVSVCGVCDVTATCRRVKSWLAAVVCIPSWSVAGASVCALVGRPCVFREMSIQVPRFV